MIGVAVPIEGEEAERLDEVGRVLREILGDGARGIPHISLHVAEGYKIGEAERALRSLAHSQDPFPVFVAGFGFFAEKPPVLHLTVTRSPRLAVLQRVVVQEVARFASEPDPNFTAERWVPHITLWRGVLPPGSVGRVAERLACLDLRFELPVGALALIEDNGNEQRLIHKHTLSA